MSEELSREDRLRLIRFVCSFAWADLEVVEKEREFIARLVKEYALDEEEQELVDSWLEFPPAPDAVDPTDIPSEQRQLFLKTALELVAVDGHVDPDEVENFALFEQLLR